MNTELQQIAATTNLNFRLWCTYRKCQETGTVKTDITANCNFRFSIVVAPVERFNKRIYRRSCHWEPTRLSWSEIVKVSSCFVCQKLLKPANVSRSRFTRWIETKWCTAKDPPTQNIMQNHWKQFKFTTSNQTLCSFDVAASTHYDAEGQKCRDDDACFRHFRTVSRWIRLYSTLNSH